MRVYTVKEVRKYTGLTRKQLYDYKKSIPPIGMENEAGYKLYDQEGLEKLSIAALLAELGAGPQRINDIFGADDYDRKKVIKDLIDEAKREREHLDDIITVAEEFIKYNLSKMSYNMFQLRDLHQLATDIRQEKDSEDVKNYIEKMDADTFSKLIEIYGRFEKYINKTEITEELERDVDAIACFASETLGLKNTARFVYTQALALLVYDDYKAVIDNATRKGLSDVIADSILAYLTEHLTDELIELDDNNAWDAFVDEEFSSDGVRELVDKVAAIIQKWYGYGIGPELEMAVEGLKIKLEQGSIEEDAEYIIKFFEVLLKAAKYYENESQTGVND